MAVVCGLAWGLGALMFAQGVRAIGISFVNTVVPAISSSLGSFLPILVLDPSKLFERQGEASMAGTAIAIAGIAFCGYAGELKEHSQANENVRQELVGEARPFWFGLLFCAGGGVLSAVFKIGYSSAQSIVRSAVRLGDSPLQAPTLSGC